jgi:Protein of unknown function (DUF2510)
MTTWQPPVLFEERLRASGRAWWWLLVISVVAFFTIGMLAVPIAILAWFVNVGRFRGAVVRIDTERIWVGQRSLRLGALDLDTVGRATNPWPWRVFSNRYLGGNPFWTRDSVGIRGREGKRKCWVAVGTNRRDELLTTLTGAVATARTRAMAAADAYAGRALPPPGWYDDPWDGTQIRWWDGQQWSGYAAPRPMRMDGVS